ncbi:pyrimidine-specific ribonucleoside hydrolase [Nocardia sp. GAS34]|uniref:nucleoside hydrolase n=1 Tax=unclassified Nocardia TaxID=2637762 RepID=UPI003D1CEE89
MAIILDTDIGGEPDDALALAVAAGLPELSLVITSDEHNGRRAKMARQILDLLMRSDVPVVAGRDLGRTENWAAEGIVPPGVPDQPTDVLTAVDALLGRTPEPVMWVGTGPMSNLADVLTAFPTAAQRLVVTQVGGSLAWYTDRPEPTIEADLPAARAVLSARTLLRLLPVETTMHLLNAIDRDAVEYDIIARADDPVSTMLRKHMEVWFDHHRSSIDQSALLALALAVDPRLFTVTPSSIGLDPVGRLQSGEHSVLMVDTFEHLTFRAWSVPLVAGIKDLPDRAIPSLLPIRAQTAREMIEVYQPEPHSAASEQGEQ